MHRHVSPLPASTAVAGCERASADRRGAPVLGRAAVQSPRRSRAVMRDRRCFAYRANIAARAVAGSVGAYAVAAALAALLARLLPMARPEAVMTGMLAALPIVPAVTIWAFLTRSPSRALGGVAIAALALGIWALMLPQPPA